MHPLHKLIGKILTTMQIPEGRVILDMACGGDQHIQLFCTDRASRESRYCFVDAAILQHDKVKVIFEIEESDIRPAALCGKVFVSALASYFIHRSVEYPMAEKTAFVQIIDTRKLSPDSSKIDQCRYLSQSIVDSLQLLGKPLQNYQIFHGDIAEFQSAKAQEELREHILKVATT